MIELRLNGAPFPAAIAVGLTYEVTILVNGASVFPSSWTVTTGPYTIASGHSSKIIFTPRVAALHTIRAEVVGEFGLYTHVAKSVNVSAKVGGGEAGVVWSKLVFIPGENLVATIAARDSRGITPTQVVWTLFRNNAPILSGRGATLNYTGTMPGVYRLKGIAYCADGTQLSFDSTAFVQGGTNVRHSLPIPEYDGTLIYIGSVFTQNISGAAGSPTELPYKIASASEDMFLLPGTTHWCFDLDPDTTPVDDEVVVRTHKGNWCLNGLGGGLSGEDIGYDYGYMPTYIPAPVDYRLRVTAEFFKTHIAVDPNTIVVTGAGTADVNGEYVLTAPGQWSKGDSYVILFADFGPFGTEYIIETADLTSALYLKSISTSGVVHWTVQDGANPAPSSLDFKTSLAFNACNSRVRIRCYRLLPTAVYRYGRCAYSTFPGGEGRRTRRWAASFTKLDIQSGGAGAVIAYTTDSVTSVPLQTLTTSGTPNPVPGYSGMFYTDSNLYSFYEADGKLDLSANAISAIEGVRPCCVSLLQFNNSKPLLFNRVKRVYGKLQVFLMDGVVFDGSLVNVKIHTWKDNQDYMTIKGAGAISGTYQRGGSNQGKPYYGVTPYSSLPPGSAGIFWDGTKWFIVAPGADQRYYSAEDVPTPDLVTVWQKAPDVGQPPNPIVYGSNWSLPVSGVTYVDTDSTILKVAEVDVDLSDYQFDETGLVIDIQVDETNAVTGSIPDPVPTSIVGPEFIYSTGYSHTVAYDGACYTNPSYTPVLDDYAVIVTPLGGCQDMTCGPAALYCYTALYPPSENAVLPQPFGQPAPFLAYGTNPARCFYNPIAQGFEQVVTTGTVVGTQTSTDEFFGSFPVDLWGYSDGSLCGYSYQYNTCNTYGPCVGHNCSIIVVYPVSASPHSVVDYSGRCYAFAGSTQDYGTRLVVGSGSVTPAPDCASCASVNLNGSVVVYNDKHTFLEVPVRFDHLDHGIAHYGVAAQVIDEGWSGLSPGRKVVVFSNPMQQVYKSTGAGSMMFEFQQLTGKKKQIVVDHNGAQRVYDPGIGGGKQIVALQVGDTVYIRMTDGYNRLPLQYRGLTITLTWHPIEFLPRLFDTVVVPYSGSSAVNAIGFTAYTSEGVYSFYGTLPFDGSMVGPLNPESLVTVTGQDGQEYNLVNMRAVGDPMLFKLTTLPWYAGQVLNGPFTFKFYSARRAFGAHGEMDVWFNTNGTFPGFFRAGVFDALELSGTYYRTNGSPLDTHRNAYAVIDANTAAGVNWPCVYLDEITGQIITATVDVQTISI